MRYGSVLLWVLIVLLCGCSGDGNPNTDNGRVRVHNNTDDVITVDYVQELSVGEHISYIAKTVSIPSGESLIITIDTWLYKGEFSATYKSETEIFNVYFDLIGKSIENEDVDQDDFSVSTILFDGINI